MKMGSYFIVSEKLQISGSHKGISKVVGRVGAEGATELPGRYQRKCMCFYIYIYIYCTSLHSYGQTQISFIY